MTILLLQNLGNAWGYTVQTLSIWHERGTPSWDQGDGNDVAPFSVRNTDIAQTIQASGEQT